MKGYFIALKEAKILVKCEIEIKPASPHLLWNLDTYLNSKLCWPSSWKYMYLLSWYHFSNEIPLPRSRGGVFHSTFNRYQNRIRTIWILVARCMVMQEKWNRIMNLRWYIIVHWLHNVFVHTSFIKIVL